MSASRPRADLVAEFDAFYKDARDRLLLQTFALTGDLGASRSAVRDAFVVAWHHWRKVSRLGDPEMTVRPQAWRNALRRATARPWHKEKALDPELRRTLEALAALSVSQRKALLLTQLAHVSMAEMAREVGVPAEQAEQDLQNATSQFAIQREITSTAIPLAFAELAEATGGVTWPRVTIIRRAGAARRRAHTLVGAVAVVAALVGTGVLVTDAAGVRPTLDRAPTPSATAGPVTGGPEVTLPDTSLLPTEAVRQGLFGAGWSEVRTTDNSTGNGMALPCQKQRYADPAGDAAWVRVFRNGPREESTRTLTQTAEASTSTTDAHATFLRVRRWVAGCTTPGIQLVSTATAEGLGDESAVFVLRSTAPEATYVVAMARTGLFTTALALDTDVPPERADREGVADLLGTAVDRLCALPDGGGCAAPAAELTDVAPFPAGSVPALLSPVDLPVVGDPADPWVGTRPQEITGNRTDLSVLGCSTVTFGEEYREQRFRTRLARTFVKPSSDLPAEFGLTQAVGSLPADAAGAFVAQFRAEITRCPELDAGAGTDVRLLRRLDDGDRAFSAWHLSTELSDEQRVEYDVAIVRDGTALTELVFISTPDARMAEADFVALVERALARLPEQAPYDRSR